jgi:hypothetical protein
MARAIFFIIFIWGNIYLKIQKSVTEKELYDSLDYVNHSRQKRQEMASLVLNNPHLVKPLLRIAFEVNNPVSCKACWVMEFTAKNNLSHILPHIDFFTDQINAVKFDSSVRPIAKICEVLMNAYFNKTKNRTQDILKIKNLEQIAAASFDWLIGEHKVAAKAYSMTCLLLLGQKFDWIHPELKMVLEQNYALGSAAYKARARMTLAKLK